jgi:hypothetical protein
MPFYPEDRDSRFLSNTGNYQTIRILIPQERNHHSYCTLYYYAICSVRVNCCWPSPAQPFLVPSSAGLMTIFFCLTTPGVMQLYLGDPGCGFLGRHTAAFSMHGNLATGDSTKQTGLNETQQCSRGMAMYRMYYEGVTRKRYGLSVCFSSPPLSKFKNTTLKMAYFKKYSKYCDPAALGSSRKRTR